MYRRKVPAVSTSEGCAVAQPRAAGVRGQRGVSVGSWVHLERRWSGSRLRRWGPGTLAHACCACHAGRWGWGCCAGGGQGHWHIHAVHVMPVGGAVAPVGARDTGTCMLCMSCRTVGLWRRWGPGTLAHACCACHAGRWGCGVCVQADTLHVQFFVLRSSAVAVSAAQPAAVGACGKRPLWQVFLWSFEEFMAVDWSGRL